MDKILNTIYNAIDDKKGGNTRILDISQLQQYRIILLLHPEIIIIR